MPRNTSASKQVKFVAKPHARATGMDEEDEGFSDLEDRMDASQSVNPGGFFMPKTLSSDDSRYN